MSRQANTDRALIRARAHRIHFPAHPTGAPPPLQRMINGPSMPSVPARAKAVPSRAKDDATTFQGRTGGRRNLGTGTQAPSPLYPKNTRGRLSRRPGSAWALRREPQHAPLPSMIPQGRAGRNRRPASAIGAAAPVPAHAPVREIEQKLTTQSFINNIHKSG